MRWIGLVVIAVVGCGGMDAPAPGFDGGVVEEPPPAGLANLAVHIGDRCEDGQGLVCGDGALGACADSVCRAQCAATTFPRCASGFVEGSVESGGRATCVCVPE